MKCLIEITRPVESITIAGSNLWGITIGHITIVKPGFWDNYYDSRFTFQGRYYDKFTIAGVIFGVILRLQADF